MLTGGSAALLGCVLGCDRKSKSQPKTVGLRGVGRRRLWDSHNAPFFFCGVLAQRSEGSPFEDFGACEFKGPPCNSDLKQVGDFFFFFFQTK